MYFVELPRAAIDEASWDLALKSTRWGVAELELPYRPALRFYRDGAPWMAALKGFDGFEHETTRPGGLTGAAVHDPWTVWIRDGLSRSELVVTVLHELKHLRQGPWTAGSKAAWDERHEAEAERWGRQAAQVFESRPRGLKSAADLVAPTASLARTGAVIGINDRPGVTIATDFGDSLYGTRPLILNGWGVQAKRIGTVTDVGSFDDSEEQLWMLGQLEQHDRYLRYVQRLLEQNAVGAHPMVLDKMVRRDDAGRLTQLPVLGVELRPQVASSPASGI